MPQRDALCAAAAAGDRMSFWPHISGVGIAASSTHPVDNWQRLGREQVDVLFTDLCDSPGRSPEETGTPTMWTESEP